MGKISASTQSLGGKARAESLSEKERKAIASKAAAARWGMPRASHSGDVRIGSYIMQCHVLEDERRLISQRGFMDLLGMKGRGSTGHRITQLIDNPAAKSQKINKLRLDIENPVRFLHQKAQVTFGYDSQLIIDFCKALMELRSQKALPDYALKYAVEAERFIVALAGVGLAALIDEATGYQKVRAKKALEELLDRYLLKEFSAWAKRFPDEFYIGVFRLKDVALDKAGRRPMWVGKVTNDLVYERIEVGLLKELQVRNPVVQESRRRKGYHHCLLTEDLGVPALAQHLHTLITLMKGFSSGNWRGFHDFVNTVLPKKGESVQLLLDLESMR